MTKILSYLKGIAMKKSLHALNIVLKGNLFTLVDIGAAGGAHKRWNDISELLRVVGFEPDEKEFVKLKNSDREMWFNIALSNIKGKRMLHITKSQTNTSFLMPNQNLLKQLQWSPGEPVTDHDIIKEVEVECDALDGVLKNKNVRPDYLKLDTQGSELDILKGADRVLREDLLIAEIEVEFAPIYKDQPLFADIDAFMRERGFILQDLGNFLYMKPRGLAGVGGAKGRIIAADALYIKDFSNDFRKLYELGENKVFAAIAGYAAYGYPELGINLLQRLRDSNCDINDSDGIIGILRKIRPSSISLPGISKLAKTCGKIWFKHREVEHCLWDVPLGN